jgi:hypothetical protein
MRDVLLWCGVGHALGLDNRESLTQVFHEALYHTNTDLNVVAQMTNAHKRTMTEIAGGRPALPAAAPGMLGVDAPRNEEDEDDGWCVLSSETLETGFVCL